MNEIEIKHYTLPQIEIEDYEQLKKFVEDDTKKYQKYLVTEETLDGDVKKRAELRKIAKKIDDRRIAITKEISEPIDKFKKDCDYLKQLYEQSATLIDKQIKVFEEVKKNEKKLLCEKIYNELIMEFKDQISFEKIFNEKWLNKGTKEDMIRYEISDIVDRTRKSVETIKSLNSEFELELINTYFNSLDVNKAILKNNQLLEQKQKMEEVIIRQNRVKEEKVNEMLSKATVEEEIDPIKIYTLKITAPLSKQKTLRQFLELNNMKYEKVD